MWGPTLFFQVSNMGARPFFEVEKVGTRTFLAWEIGGLVVFFGRKIPQNPAWVPGKFWTVPNCIYDIKCHHVVPTSTSSTSLLKVANISSRKIWHLVNESVDSSLGHWLTDWHTDTHTQPRLHVFFYKKASLGLYFLNFFFDTLGLKLSWCFLIIKLCQGRGKAV